MSKRQNVSTVSSETKKSKNLSSKTSENIVEKLLTDLNNSLDLAEADVCDSSGIETWVEDINSIPLPCEQILGLENVNIKWRLALRLTSIINSFLLELVSFYFDSDSFGRIPVCEKYSKDIIQLWNSLLTQIKETGIFPTNLNNELKDAFTKIYHNGPDDKTDVFTECDSGNSKIALVHVKTSTDVVRAALDAVSNGDRDRVNVALKEVSQHVPPVVVPTVMPSVNMTFVDNKAFSPHDSQASLLRLVAEFLENHNKKEECQPQYLKGMFNADMKIYWKAVAKATVSKVKIVEDLKDIVKSQELGPSSADFMGKINAILQPYDAHQVEAFSSQGGAEGDKLHAVWLKVGDNNFQVLLAVNGIEFLAFVSNDIQSNTYHNIFNQIVQLRAVGFKYVQGSGSVGIVEALVGAFDNLLNKV